ncbi:MAG: Ig-like domain-containing protein, partial [Deltaproteobacteria bacterium]|nr:Ig-like domain-containing protein [Deltaproteobacteria bacterium]
MNNAPVAVEISAVTPEDNTAGLDIILEATDADGDELTFNVESNPAKGNVIINGNVATYTPSANKTGRDTFTFYANDGKVSSATVTATIDITPVPDAPSLSGSTTASVDEGGSLSFSATLTDVDLDNEGDSHSYTLSGNPVWVSINPDTGELTGTPVEANIGTTEGLIITVTDQGSLSATHTLSITVNDVPYAPSSATASITTNEDTASEGETPLVVDADTNDTHTFAITSTTLPAMGTASVVDNQLVYMPSANVHGMDSFSFSATDQSGNSVEGTASVTILPVNDAPSLSGSTTASVDEGGSLSFSATLTDVDEGDSHSYTLSGNPVWVSIN